MNHQEKNKYRLSKEWKEHRLKLISNHSDTCNLCQAVRRKGLVIHHKDMNSNNYTDLSDPSSFAVLCSSCHKLLHRLYSATTRRKNPTTNPDVMILVRPYFVVNPDRAEGRLRH